jgi:hypothetical protein
MKEFNVKKQSVIKTSVIAALTVMSVTANAALWSDTSIGYRYGTQYREPVNSQDISKNIVDLQHVSGYKYGTNFLNLDLLFSDSKDPISAGSSNGAQEAYLVYRHTLDMAAITGYDLKYGIVRNLGITVGFDVNFKNDAGYNSSKRMWVLGPTVMFDVPGFFNLSAVALWESNAPYNSFTGVSTPRYEYDTHAALMGAWGVPFSVGPVALSFEGFFNYIGAKGHDEFGAGTKPEFNFDGQVMYDVSPLLDINSNTFKVGFEYQYWRNKFGNDNQNPFFLGGATASTPMVRVEYHF